LGEDLLVEILIRGLPNPRSACRGKLVCKLWSSLISNPRFNRNFVSYHQITNQLNHPPMPSDPYELHLIIRNFLPPMPKQVSDTITVLDCNQDLVLCGFWDVDPYQVRERSRSYLVCNPFTKQWIALPLAPVSRRFKTEANMDRVMKSAFYKDYIEHVTAKATVHMVAEVIKHRLKRIGGKSPPISHNELDVMGADLADVEADIAILGKQIEKLQKALVHQTAELPHLPPCSNQSLVGREPSRWRVKHILGLIARALHLRKHNL
ncbi:unnamed protein product, partial [Linum tenue]